MTKPEPLLARDLIDTVAVAVAVHGVPRVERALATIKKQLATDPDQPLIPTTRRRRDWNEPPFARPEDATPDGPNRGGAPGPVNGPVPRQPPSPGGTSTPRRSSPLQTAKEDR